jgi:hypothetical protein
MGKMLGRKVWMFHESKEAVGTFTGPFLLSASIENVLDTWGGWVSLQEDGNIPELFIHTGGGSIRNVENDEGEQFLVENEISCHWCSELEDSSLDPSPIPLHVQLLIGATKVNELCPLKPATCQPAIRHRLVTLGTRAPSWKTTGRGAGLGGGHWGATATLNVSQTKDDGRNKKQLMIDSWRASKDLQKLNSPWGLELSLCTGIARRVLLRNLMYGDALKYLQVRLPGEWKDIKDVAESISGLSNEQFEKLLQDDLSKEQAEVLKKAVELLILAMEETGVEKDGHTLKLWWPEPNESDTRGLRFTQAQYSGKNPWISMIKDSEHCAVFGMATTRCLQHDDIKVCRHPAGANVVRTWQDVERIMLDTTLIPAEEYCSLPYAKDERYLLWKKQGFLQVVRPMVGDTTVVQLTYFPGWVRPRIVMKKLNKVKEKQGLSDTGQVVLIL